MATMTETQINVRAARHVYAEGAPPRVCNDLIRLGRIWLDCYRKSNAGYPTITHPQQAWRDVPAGTPEQVAAAVDEANRLSGRKA